MSNVIYPTLIGQPIVAPDVTTMEALDVTAPPLIVGTLLYNIAQAAAYTLTVSTATIDHVATCAVTGATGLRWIKFTGGSSVDPGTVVTVAGSAVASVDFTPLTGDTDGDYMLSGEVLVSTGADTDIMIQLNGDATTANYVVGLQYTNSLSTSNVATNGLGTGLAGSADGGVPIARIGNSSARDRVTFTNVRISAKSGRIHPVGGKALAMSSANAAFAVYDITGAWLDTTHQITKVSVTTVLGTAIIAVGSWVKLVKSGANA